ncbi:MAG: phosphatidate cytidylyltransferase [Stellaceae bacterium]
MNIADAIAAMEPALARVDPIGELDTAERDRPWQRVGSALVLAPLPIAAIWFGTPWLALLSAAAAAIMAWEWDRLCCGGGRSASWPVGLALVGTVLAAVALAALPAIGIALCAALAGAAIVSWTARRARAEPGWAALGALWVALPCIALLWLTRQGTGSRATLLWMLAVVWATDTGAYAVGRTIGGPRLAPRLSPRKTWSGFAGGIGCAALIGAATAFALGRPPGKTMLLSAGLAIIAQFGDLAESLAKRRFRVKDSSGLIPGHGGLLDRLDGLLAVIPAVALLTWIGGGSVLGWR